MSKGCEKKKKRGAIKSLPKLCLSLIPCLLFLAVAHGAEYPTKTIQLVSNFPPGGSTDIVARILHKKLSTLLGQPIPVVNKAGGGGTVGTQSVAAAPADGYTILASTPTIVISPLTVKGLPFSFRDFSPVNLAVYMPSVVSVKKEAHGSPSRNSFLMRRRTLESLPIVLRVPVLLPTLLVSFSKWPQV